VVLAGDARLIEKLRREELLPLGSRIRTRLATEHASPEELLACLDHVLAEAGNASLMTPSLRHTLCDHAAGNYRILTTLAAELLRWRRSVSCRCSMRNCIWRSLLRRIACHLAGRVRADENALGHAY
jgi:hypothetical protein